MDLKLTDKIALITGASRGLGFATAKLLASEGARIAINSRSTGNLQKAATEIKASQQDAEPLLLAGDITQPSTPEEIIQQTVAHWGGLDILIANAGGQPSGKFENFTDEDWKAAFELSFLSQVRLIRAAIPFLKQSSCASVLTVTSFSVKQPIPNLILSNSIRAATVGLTKSLALELGNENIRFNSILPAWTETERVQELIAFRARQNNTSVQIELDRQAQESPLGRMAQPEEFAAAAVFLVSPVASYITGVMFSVDGGMYKGTF